MFFENFCYCLSLERGGYILSVFGILSGITQIIAAFTILVKKLTMYLFDVKIDYTYLWLVNMFSGVLLLISSVLLYKGVQKERPELLIPALVVDVTAMCYEVYATLVRYLDRYQVDGAALDFFTCLFLLSICCYFWLCLFSLYCVLLKRKNMPTV